MKIKCPACPNEIEIDERLYHDDILRHFFSFPHESNPQHLIIRFAELIFKIHEKIESLEKENLGRGHLRKCIEHIESLLEPEK